jgi:hypothetical protein
MEDTRFLQIFLDDSATYADTVIGTERRECVEEHWVQRFDDFHQVLRRDGLTA